jgi:hypothetical protein
MENRENPVHLIVDTACVLILIALLVVPMYAQHAAEVQAKAHATHVTVSAAYHKGANLARP